MTSCMTTPSHSLNQFWRIISSVVCHSNKGKTLKNEMLERVTTTTHLDISHFKPKTHVQGTMSHSWWRHQTETSYALVALCKDGFPPQRPVARSFDVFFDLRLKKWLRNNRDDGDLIRHHYDATVMLYESLIIPPTMSDTRTRPIDQ